VFVLVTARPGVLLPTIRSRCCQLRFAPVPQRELAPALVARHGFSERDARAAAALSAGSFARAFGSNRSDLVEARAVAADVLGRLSRAVEPKSRLSAGEPLVKKAGKNKKVQARESSDSTVDRGMLALRLRAISSLLRDVTVLCTRAPEDALVNLDLRAELESLAGTYDRARLDRAFSAVGRALVALERNANPKIVVDWLAFHL
jgi:DNA polymerase-3 subunit delta'